MQTTQTNEKQTAIKTLDEELTELDLLKSQQMEGKGFKEFYKLSTKGVHEFEVEVPVAIREGKNLNGEAQGILAIKNVVGQEVGKQFDLGINKKNPFYYQLLKAIKSGQSKFKIMTSGEGKGTRFEILNLQGQAKQ